MDIYAIRKQNLINLIGTRRKNACALRWEMAPAHLSQILSDRTEKNLGDDVARRIESLEGLERGWMDQLREPEPEGLVEAPHAGGKTPADLVRAMLATKAGKALSKEAQERLLGAAEDQPASTFIQAPAPATKGEILIPQYDIRASMGHGQVAPDYAEVVRNVIVKESYLQENGITFTSPAHLAMITGWGQSMEGTINDKDPLIVDRGINEFVGDGIYVLTWNDHLYIKRLQMVDKETIELISDNPKHKDREVPLKDVTIHARVLLIWNAKKA
ncbi:hypothetical protein L682_30125 [Aquipseudomonas alcaligenes OT 69]|nr:hypothetical protein L682_30125 [Pseudomonas alcaligenes OT 69]